MTASGRDEVTEHGRRRFSSASTSAVEHQRSRCLGFDEHGILGLVHSGKRMFERDERGMYARTYAELLGTRNREALRDRQELDHVTRLARGLHLLERDLGDALSVDRFERNRGVECEARQNCRLLCGIEATDIRRWIRLRIAERCGFRQSGLHRRALGVHEVKDVVRRAVDNAKNASHLVASETVAQWADDRDRATNRRLVVQLRPDLLCGVKEFWTVGGEQCLIARDHVGAAVDCLEHERAGRLEPADELDDDVGPEDQRFGVGGEQVLRNARSALGVDVAHRDPYQFKACTRAAR